jgi:hypothetical protein
MGGKIMVDLAAISLSVVNVFFIVSIIAVGGGILAFLTWYILREMKYNLKVVWWSSSDDKTGGTDRGGIFVDSKTKNKRFFLKKANVGLEPDNIPYKFIGKHKTVYLLRDGLKNFRYFDINTTGNPEITVNVGEEDVNWAINAYERQKRLFSQTLLMQLMPFIALAFVSIIILIIFIYFFKDFAVLKDVALSLKEGAQELAKAKAGTTVISP